MSHGKSWGSGWNKGMTHEEFVGILEVVKEGKGFSGLTVEGKMERIRALLCHDQKNCPQCVALAGPKVAEKFESAGLKLDGQDNPNELARRILFGLKDIYVLLGIDNGTPPPIAV